MKSIKELVDLKGKRVLVRVDFNVPVKDCRILDDARLNASLPTVKYLIDHGARVVLLTHLGRPDGQVVNELKVGPVAERFGELIGREVEVVDLDIDRIKYAIETLPDGEVLMLENIRFSPDEKKNTGTLAKDLAGLADMFVLDGFAVAHRASASVVGIPRYIQGYAGFLLEKEISGLNRIVGNPEHPFIVILGGAKIETKIPIISNLIGACDNLLIGGGIFNTYLSAKGHEVGSSLVNPEFNDQALLLCGNEKVIKPVDVVVVVKDGSASRIVGVLEEPHKICEENEAILDIGPRTIELFKAHIEKALTLVWNGAMGYFEQKPYDAGTMEIARLAAEQAKGRAFGVIGGGETLQSVEMIGMTDCFDLASTGGAAMLEFLSGEELPGIKALE